MLFAQGTPKKQRFYCPRSHIYLISLPRSPFPLCPASSRPRQQRAEMTRRCRLCSRTLLSHSFSCATAKLVLLAHRLSNAWTAVVCRVWLVSVTCAGDEAALYHIQRNYICLDIHSSVEYTHTPLKVDSAVRELRLEGRLLFVRRCAITRKSRSCAFYVKCLTERATCLGIGC